MSKASMVALCRSAAWIGVLGASLVACRKDEPPPPLPAAPKAVEAPPVAAPLELKPDEDAGKPPEPAVAPAPAKTTAAHKASTGLAACCAALRQNAANAPPPTKDYMTYAAGICDLAAAQGKEKSSIVGSIQAALKGAGLPSDCK